MLSCSAVSARVARARATARHNYRMRYVDACAAERPAFSAIRRGRHLCARFFVEARAGDRGV